MPKATPTVARFSATARAASSGARTMTIIISRVTSVIASTTSGIRSLVIAS